MSLRIEGPGLLSTIQDLGRFGFQKDGVVVGGAMDALALRIGNLLVGNQEGSPGMEVVLIGPEIRFEAPHLVAITGANLSPMLNGQPVPMGRPLWVGEGSLLEFGKPKAGRFSYISVAGGFNIPKVMGSYSTYVRAGFGGLHGRPLKKGDSISCVGPPERLLTFAQGFKRVKKNWRFPDWGVAGSLHPSYEKAPVIRFVKGPEWDFFSEESRRLFGEENFKISTQSDRMGYQLEGSVLSLQEKREMISSAVTFGTVQVPPCGQPIILGADRQTTGGYPRIAQVISADLSKLVQVQPGKTIRFREVSLQEALQLFYQQEKNLECLKRAIQLKIGGKLN